MRAMSVLIVSAFLFAGCNQEVRTATPQSSAQALSTPTATDQELLTAGSDVRVYIVNGPGGSCLPDGESVADLESVSTEGVNVGKTAAGYAQSGIVLNITTGGTTPSATGTTSGSASGTQSPAQSVTSSPIQDVKPEFTSAVPITVGLPGSATSGSANAGGSGGSVTNPNASPSQSPQYTQLRVPAQYAADLVALIQGWLAQRAATTQPE